MRTVLYGCGATARLVYAAGAPIDGVLVDTETVPLGDLKLGRAPVYDAGTRLQTCPPNEYRILICLGYQHGTDGPNGRRAEVREMLQADGYLLSDWMGGYASLGAEIGPGCIVLAGSVLHPGAVLTENVFVGSNVTVGHDVTIREDSWVNSGVSLDGGAAVGRRCVIGANAVIGKGIAVGHGSIVGPGAVVLRHVPPNSVVLAAESMVVPKLSSKTFLGWSA